MIKVRISTKCAGWLESHSCDTKDDGDDRLYAAFHHSKTIKVGRGEVYEMELPDDVAADLAKTFEDAGEVYASEPDDWDGVKTEGRAMLKAASRIRDALANNGGQDEK